MDAGFKEWAKRGIVRLKDLLSEDVIMTSEHMIGNFGIPTQDFFRYLQLRHYISHGTTIIEHPELSPTEKLSKKDGRMSVSLFYEALNVTSPADLWGLKGTWKKELSVIIDDESW